MKVFVSWSGGKESCFACREAISDSLEPVCLLNMVTKDAKKSMTHRIRSDLLRTQSECIGIPIIQKRTTWNTYEHDFKEIVRELRAEGIEGGVFGNINIQEHREWVERVSGELGITVIEPLWGMRCTQVLEDFIAAGFKALVVCQRADLSNGEMLARHIDRTFVEDLARRGIDLCGEGGEYHTFVLDGPLFERQIKVKSSKKMFNDGYWWLDVEEWEITEKRGENYDIEINPRT